MALSCITAEDVLKTVKDKNVQMIDLRFTDLPGGWQHFSVPPSAVDADALNEGIGFDGSSIRGFQEIQESCGSARQVACYWSPAACPGAFVASANPFSGCVSLVRASP